MSNHLSRISLDDKLNPAKTLSQLSFEALELSRLLIESHGELTQEIEERLTVNTDLLQRKVDAYVFIEDRFQAESDYFKRKADFFSKLSKAYLKQIDSLRERIKDSMRTLGKNRIDGNEYRYLLGKSAPKLVIENEEAIPTEYKMIVQVTQLDKEKIKEALVNGFEVPGAHIEENGTLRVYEQTGKE